MHIRYGYLLAVRNSATRTSCLTVATYLHGTSPDLGSGLSLGYSPARRSIKVRFDGHDPGSTASRSCQPRITLDDRVS
jgi:hypothetical protein